MLIRQLRLTNSQVIPSAGGGGYRVNVRVEYAQGCTHFLATMPSQQPYETAELLVQQRGEINKQCPEQQGQDDHHKGVGHQLLPWCHHIESECNLVAVIFQPNTVDRSLQDVATGLLHGQMAGTRTVCHGRRVFVDQLIHCSRRMRGDVCGGRGGVERPHFGRHCRIILEDSHTGRAVTSLRYTLSSAQRFPVRCLDRISC